MSRYKFFWVAGAIVFVYTWIPQWFASTFVTGKFILVILHSSESLVSFWSRLFHPRLCSWTIDESSRKCRFGRILFLLANRDLALVLDLSRWTGHILAQNH
jgi:hypothetical protein